MRTLVTAEQVISVLLLLAILALIFTQVVARYVFEAPLFWSDELARYMYVWLSFVAAVFVTAERRHIQIGVINRLLGQRGRLVVEVLAGLIVIATCLFFVHGSWPWLLTNIRPRSPALRVPLVWLYGVVWLAFAVMALHTLINVVRLLAGTEQLEADDGFEDGAAP